MIPLDAPRSSGDVWLLRPSASPPSVMSRPGPFIPKAASTLALIALGLTILLPLDYTIAVYLMARNRAALGRGFPILVRICLGVLPIILVGTRPGSYSVRWDSSGPSCCATSSC